jgi:hypothetical protein
MTKKIKKLKAEFANGLKSIPPVKWHMPVHYLREVSRYAFHLLILH